jgi:hypothetical protein
MNLINLIKGLLNLQKKLDTKVLPSQGLFYNDDFEIFIKRADTEDIIEYEYNYDFGDVMSVISRIKKVVSKNIILSSGYDFIDVKSIDVIFLFLEIVRFTKNKPISLPYFNDEIGRDDIIEFGQNSFNYFRTDGVMQYYDEINKQFIIDGYKFTLPAIGVEDSITNYLINKSNDLDAVKYNDYNYDFAYFLGNKNKITYDEIENLVHIFNFDLSDDEKKKIKKIVNTFQTLQKYSLRKGNRVIDLTSKINLQQIWK